MSRRKSRRAAMHVGTENSAPTPTPEAAAVLSETDPAPGVGVDVAAISSEETKPSGEPVADQPAAAEASSEPTGDEPAGDLETEPAPAATDEKQPEQEEIAPATHILVNASVLIAAATCCLTGKDGEARPYLSGVYVHVVDDYIRFVGTDGHRMLVVSQKLLKDDPKPKWLERGIILPGEHLKARLSIIGKVSESGLVKLTFAETGKLELSDLRDDSVFRLFPIDATYPDYQRVVAANFGAIAPEGPRADLRGTAFNGQYLKGVGDIAKILSGDKAKVQVSLMTPGATLDGKDGGDPTIITFPYAPGAVMYLMPMRAVSELAPATVAILQPAIKGSIAALKAHETRNRQAAKEATTEAEKAELLATADRFKARIAGIMQAASGKALTKPEEKPAEANGKAKDEKPKAETKPVADLLAGKSRRRAKRENARQATGAVNATGRSKRRGKKAPAVETTAAAAE